MNKQEIFTKVKNHLLTQRKKSWAEDVGCKYRGPNGLTCAVGCLIPDELYVPDMERNAYGYSAAYDQEFIEKFPEVGKLFDEGTIEFLRELQQIHDSANVVEWASRLQQLAIQENLEFYL